MAGDLWLKFWSIAFSIKKGQIHDSEKGIGSAGFRGLGKSFEARG